MLTAMLLGALTLVGPTADPDPAIRVWFDQEDAYMRGDRVRVFLKTRDDRYVVVFHLDPENRLRVLFPLDPGDDNYVRGGKKYKVVGRGGRDGFVAEVSGRGIVFAAASGDPFRFDEFTRDQYWDYRQLNAMSLEGDVEQAMVELVQRMSTGRFDYDIIRYSTFADATDLASPGTALAYDVDPASIPTCLSCRPNTTVVIGVGGPAYCASPLYDPLCYDPYFYSPGWVPPAYWNAGWGWYDPWYGYGWGGNWNWGGGWYGGGWYPAPAPRPYPNQYQFKRDTRRWSEPGPGYRPRGDEFRNVNTVAGPLPSTGRTAPADRRRIYGGGAAAVPVVANPPSSSEPARERPSGGRSEPQARPRDREQPTPRREWSGEPRESGGQAERSRGSEGGRSAPSGGASSRGGDRGGSGNSVRSDGDRGSGSSGGSRPSGGGSSGGGGRRRG